MKITKEKIQKILYDFANMKITKNLIEYDILYELLKKHPQADEKIGVGVDYFFVQKSKWKFNQFNFMIKRLDGTTVDFSFYRCLSPNQKLSNDENWGLIFRNIVKDQIDSFRSSAFNVVGSKDKFICSQTKLKYKKIYAHVDHVYPLTFNSIMLDFINKNKIDLKKLKLSKDTGTTDVKIILDEKINKEFYDFHKDLAVLRIVCSSANLQAKKTNNYSNECPIKTKNELLRIYPQYHID
jgi:hypothetical protein